MSISGVEKRFIDPDFRVQDDLFRHVNGRWLATHEIPQDRASDGSFRVLHDEAEVQVRQIIEDAAAGRLGSEVDRHTTGLIGDLYASFMNTELVEQLGTSPIREELQRVAGASTREELTRIMGQLWRTGIGGPVAAWVDTDPGNPSAYAIMLTQSGIGLPDESYYREDAYAQIRDAYQTHIASMLALTESDALGASPVKAAATIYAVEEKFAAGHWDIVTDRDATKTYNPMTLTALAERSPGFPWQEWCDGAGITQAHTENLVVCEPSYFETMAQLWGAEDLDDLKLWAAWRVIRARAAYLSEAIMYENFLFNGKVLSGMEEIRDRWKRGVSLVEGSIGEAVGKVYVARHFPQSSKQRVSELVDHLIEAYRRSISSLEWMSEDTRAKALAKLEKFTPKIGYPDVWRDYSGLQLDPRDLVGNVRAVDEFETAYELAKLGGPVDRNEWFMTPQTVNAYYNPGMNEIVFPAAILQPPFFNPEAEDAVNYGGIGAVIGHEIGHGFDDQGSKYDGDGRLSDWWTQTDRDEFEKRTRALIAQYDAYSPRDLDDSHHVNGALTIGENIGDLGGLAIAWLSYQIALGEQEGPEIDGMSAAQRFFFSWAECWRGKNRPEESIRRLATDPHSPEEFRCNGVVRNLDSFYQAFDVTETDALYLPPSQRVSIW